MKQLIFSLLPLLLMSCGGERHAGVRHLYDGDSQAEQRSVILASRQPNGQHCFYGGTFSQSMLNVAPSNWDEQTRQELERGSELLTPRSLLPKDVRDALLSQEKYSNIIPNIISNPIVAPVELACIASIIASWTLWVIPGAGAVVHAAFVASCGFAFASYGVALLYAKVSDAPDDANRKTRALISTIKMNSAYAEDLTSLRKIFGWIESRDAVQCPATLQLPAAKGGAQGKEKE